MELINNEIKNLLKVRTQKQTEINCLTEEIYRLEGLAFKIETNIELDEEEFNEKSKSA